MKVYLVTYESYTEGYGSYTKLLGVFSSETKAIAAISLYYSELKDYYNFKASKDEKKIIHNIIDSSSPCYDAYRPEIKEVELDEMQGIALQGYFDNITVNGKIAIGLGGYAE